MLTIIQLLIYYYHLITIPIVISSFVPTHLSSFVVIITSYFSFPALQKGANVNKTDKFLNSGIMVAAARGHYNIVELLLRRGARLSMKNSNSDTALILGAQGGYISVVKLLIEYGADVNWKNLNGLSPLNVGICIHLFQI
jgi:hypothetical protein